MMKLCLIYMVSSAIFQSASARRSMAKERSANHQESAARGSQAQRPYYRGLRHGEHGDETMYSLGTQRGGAGGPFIAASGSPDRFPSTTGTEIITGYTVWGDTTAEYRLQGAGVEVVSGATLVIQGTKGKPVQVVFQNILPIWVVTWGQRIHVQPGGTLKIEYVDFVSEGNNGQRGGGIQVDDNGEVDLSIRGLHCSGLEVCANIGTMYQAQNVTIYDSVFRNSGQALVGSPGTRYPPSNYQYAPFKYTLVGSTIKNCIVGVSGRDWIFRDVTFVGNGVASKALASDYLRADFVNNDVAVTKRNGDAMGRIVDSLFYYNRIGIDRGCECDLVNVTFQANDIAMNCSKGEWYYGDNQFVLSKGIGEMNGVNFLDSEIALQWSSSEDVSLTDRAIYWGSTETESIDSEIVDGSDGYGAGGSVVYGATVASPYIHSSYLAR